VRFVNDPGAIIYEITNVKKIYKLNYSEGRNTIQYPFSDHTNIYKTQGPTPFYWFGYNPFSDTYADWYHRPHFNRRITFRLYLKSITNGTSPGDNIAAYDPTAGVDINGNFCPIEIISQNYITDNDIPFPEDPAVFETEPKTSEGLDVFHEISDTLPLNLTGAFNGVASFGNDFAPVGSIVTTVPGTINTGQANVLGWVDNVVQLDQAVNDNIVSINDRFYFTRPDGTYTVGQFAGLAAPIDSSGPANVSFFVEIQPNVQNNRVGLGWHNCYAYGNGVESNRIRDTFNSVYIDKGPKVSTTLSEGYNEEHRKYGLIYSGLYNSTSGVNNLNQFIQAEKITKDINPTYGSIQKLHTRDTDLITLCEDKVLKILANKDAVFNADGNTNLTATANVLGQTIPFVGEYGISKNPESFASESYRAYFTDQTRGAVLRLSRDGLTPISDAGMRDWFRDHLKLSHKLVGSYDDRQKEYNITIQEDNKTITYREDVKGWVSFKSFIPENGLSCANQYYTFDNGGLWKHHDNTANRNTFYNAFSPSVVTAVLNDMPGSIKAFHTLNYEGSQSRIDSISSSAGVQDHYDTWDATSWGGSFDTNGIPIYGVSTGITPDSDYYNLTPGGTTGWFVKHIVTDKEQGTLNEFIEKEGKWFNYIKGKAWQPQ